MAAVLFCTCCQAKFSLVFGLPFVIKPGNCSCLHQVHLLFASCSLELLFGAVFSAFACWVQGVWNGLSVSMVVLLVVLSLGEECINQADNFDGFCFHYPWQKITLTFL